MQHDEDITLEEQRKQLKAEIVEVCVCVCVEVVRVCGGGEGVEVVGCVEVVRVCGGGEGV